MELHVLSSVSNNKTLQEKPYYLKSFKMVFRKSISEFPFVDKNDSYQLAL